MDDEDFDLLVPHKWYILKTKTTNYASAKINGRTVYAHRLILGVADCMQVDHKNWNGLHNWRENLRTGTGLQNSHNRQSVVGSTSKYVGVHWDKLRGKWRARIVVDDKQVTLGRFDDEVEAAIVRDEAAINYYGDFASLNFPDLRRKERRCR